MDLNNRKIKNHPPSPILQLQLRIKDVVESSEKLTHACMELELALVAKDIYIYIYVCSKYNVIRY